LQCGERKRECYNKTLVVINSLISQGNYVEAYNVAEVFLKLYIDEDIITPEEKADFCRIYMDLYEKNPEKPVLLKEKYLLIQAMSVILKSESTDKNFHTFANLLREIFSDHAEEMFDNLPLAQLILKMSLKINASLAIKTEDDTFVSDALRSAEFFAIEYYINGKKEEQAGFEYSCLKIIAAYYFGFFGSDRKRAAKMALNLASYCEKNGDEKEWGLYCYYAILLISEHMLKKGEKYYDILGDACQNATEYFVKQGEDKKAVKMLEYAILFYRNYSNTNQEKAEKKLAYLLFRTGELYKFIGRKTEAAELWNEAMILAEKYKGNKLCDMIYEYLRKNI